MQPKRTTVTGLFDSPYQYQVPIFQRGYVWTLEKQVAPLWADIQDRSDAHLERQVLSTSGTANGVKPLQKHFLGSIVMTPIPHNKFGRVPAYEVIDGQQRSTTLHLLLLAFSFSARTVSNPVLQQMLANLIRNPGPYGDVDDHHKVWPTQAGRSEMKFLNNAQTIEEIYDTYPAREGRNKLERPLMVQTFLYLYHACLAYMNGVDLNDVVNPIRDKNYSDLLTSQIRSTNSISPLLGDGSPDTTRAEALYMTLSEHIQIMTLVLEDDDDPQIIFETLNARGEPLLASDLIRNFLFLEAARNDFNVDSLYDEYWRKFDQTVTNKQSITTNQYWREKERQGRLLHPRIDLFFYNYTVLRSQEATLVTHVFQGFKSWWQKDQRNIEEELRRIQILSGYFAELITPTGTGYLAEFSRLIKSLDVGTITPIYLALRERLTAESAELKQAIGDLSSYLVRRTVSGLTTKGYNRFFLRVLRAISKSSDAPHNALRRALLNGQGASEEWPDDRVFTDSWITRPVYTEMKPARVAALLRALEYAARGTHQGSNHVPVQSALTVEHVMPQSWQNLPTYFVSGMTDDQKAIKQAALHCFGNLTILTGSLNSSVSNGPFADFVDDKDKPVLGKRSRLGQSALLINTYFQQNGLSDWDEESIRKRAATLAKTAVMVWSHPSADVSPKHISNAMSGQ
ncbi:uncharacterized protein with ParB-like and HNH nuclease domain [Advenella incenata]|uniref:Uncharacterized protein with ParB-like and HNH nuclease domain n=1 Tax=Advenella incenata TaxID=267800 RepID=A0A4V2FTI1_9BURK|nr:DUF262 domain-containing protein [Advenella incenata]RZT98235.1 uncharacterized protein with ParB-like and HNH nuclease domain [Advenella incenata]